MEQSAEPVVLIPAYEPDRRLADLVSRLAEDFRRIVIVNDGSTHGLEIFAALEPKVEKVLVHPVNRGKGAALKTGFAYLLETAGADGPPDVITVDADGQHTPADIAKVAAGLRRRRRGLVLGVRGFSGKVPLRSRFGNGWTRGLFHLLTGLRIRDTQTGLRGIPGGLLRRLAAIPGERYDYELLMLVDARDHAEAPLQIPIETVYFDGNATSHFRPLADSIRNHRALIAFRFFRRRNREGDAG